MAKAVDECGPQIRRTANDPGPEVHAGTLADRDVVLMMTGIGMATARSTTELGSYHHLAGDNAAAVAVLQELPADLAY